MKRLLLAAAALALSIPLVLAPARPVPSQGAADVQERMGRELFLTYCASCHGREALGDGPVAKALKTAPPDLTRIAARRDGEFPAAEIGMFIDGRTAVASHGTREMPVWGRRFREALGDDSVAEEIARGRIDVLIAYLRSIQSPPAAPPAPPGKD